MDEHWVEGKKWLGTMDGSNEWEQWKETMGGRDAYTTTQSTEASLIGVQLVGALDGREQGRGTMARCLIGGSKEGNDRWEVHATRFTETNPSSVHVDARVGCMDGRNGWEDAWVGSHGPLRPRLLAQVFPGRDVQLGGANTIG